MIVSCLFWQMIPEKGFFRGIVAIILASPKLFLAPTPSHLLSLLFVFLTASTLVSFDGFFVVVACLYLFIVFSVMIFHPSAHCFSEPSQKTAVVCTYTHTEIQIFKLLTVICLPVLTFFSLCMNSLCLSKFQFWDAFLFPCPSLILRRNKILAPLHALCYRAVPTLFISVTHSVQN